MMSRLLEENTDDTGTLKNEDIIRNCLAVTYAGESRISSSPSCFIHEWNSRRI